MEDHVSHPYKTTGRTVISYVSIVMLLDGIWIEWQQACPEFNRCYLLFLMEKEM
jgi:hypothetical protein